MKKIFILKHIDIEGPGTIELFLKEKSFAGEVVELSDPQQARMMASRTAEAAGVVIMGGPMNVYEEGKYPFLRDEKEWIRSWVSSKVPILGICLGAQLIASALGAKVKKGPQKEIGWYGVFLTPQAEKDRLFKSFSKEIKVFQWHEDTFDLPPDAVLLAQANGMNQAFCFQDIAWGLQFHIEVDESLVASWCDASSAMEVPLALRKEMLGAYGGFQAEFVSQARQIYAEFLQKVTDGQAAI